MGPRAAMAEANARLDADALSQEEEREALRAIYGDESVRWDASLRVLTLAIGGDDGDGGEQEDDDAASAAAAVAACALELRVLLPEDYPSRSPPAVEVVVVGGGGGEEPSPGSGEGQQLAREVDDACAEACSGGGVDDAIGDPPPLWSPGEVMLFPLAERAREIRRAWLERQLQEARRRREREREEAAVAAKEEEQEEEQEDAAAGAKTPPTAGRPNNLPPALSEDGCDPYDVDRMARLLVSGDPVVERKSAFQAHVAPVSSVADVRAAVAALLRVPKIRNCTHNIMAYRIRRAGDNSNSTWLADADDDGEDAAGGRLLQLLHSAGCEGVVVVVSRWFGGTLLGPSRFALINNTARALLVREGYIVKQKGGGGK